VLGLTLLVLGLLLRLKLGLMLHEKKALQQLLQRKAQASQEVAQRPLRADMPYSFELVAPGGLQ
jgi:hypothetical protein